MAVNSVEKPSALSSFLDSILDGTTAFAIQEDNARPPVPDHCESQRRARRSQRRSSSNSREDIAPVHRMMTMSNARWETHITSNDFIVKAPLRPQRKMYCEPEKMGGYHTTTGNMSLGALTRPLRTVEIAQRDDLPTDNRRSVESTSDLLDEALSLLVDSSSSLKPCLE